MSVSVLMINDKGLMISVLGQDYFLSYNRIPWMRNASISAAPIENYSVLNFALDLYAALTRLSSA